MAYVPPQARPVERYPGETIVPNLLNRIGTFLGSQGADFMRGLSNAPNPYAGTKFMGVPLFEGHTVTGKTLDESIQDLGPINPKPEPEASKPVEVSDKLRKLAFEKKAPGTTPESLKDYYSAQKAVGAAEKEGLSAAFGGDSPMGQWAKANPDLALRLLQKREAKGMATVGGKAVPLEEEATVEMSPMERIKFIQGGFR